VQRGEGEQFGAFASGLGDVLFVRGFSSARMDEQDLQRQQVAIATLGRMIDLVYRSLGETGVAGPNPRKTDLRIAGRRRSRNPDRSRPHQRPPASDPATELERSDQLARCVLGAIKSLPHGHLFEDLLDVWEALVTRLPAVSSLLYELEARGREPDLFECLREGTGRLGGAIAEFAAVSTVEGFASAWSAVGPFTAFIDCTLSFVRDLTTAATAEEVEVALERYHAAVLD